MTDKYIKGAMMDADMIQAYQAGDSLARFPMYHAPSVPTFRGAIELAQTWDIEVIESQTKETRINNGKRAYTAIVKARFNQTVMVGAGMSQRKTVAIGLAFRSAVQNILPADLMNAVKETFTLPKVAPTAGKMKIPRPPNGHKRWKYAVAKDLMNRAARHVEEMERLGIDCDCIDCTEPDPFPFGMGDC